MGMHQAKMTWNRIEAVFKYTEKEPGGPVWGRQGGELEEEKRRGVDRRKASRPIYRAAVRGGRTGISRRGRRGTHSGALGGNSAG